VKIALLSDYFPPHVGGIEAHVLDLAIHLRAAGTDARVITPFPGPSEMHGVPVERLRVATLPKFKMIFTIGALRALERALTDRGADLMHIHHSIVSPFAQVGLEVAERKGIPTICTFHSLMNGYLPAFRLFDRIWPRSLSSVRLSAVSAQVAAPVHELFGGEAPVVLPNGVDTVFWAGAATATAGHGGPVRVISTMRLAPRKRPRMLIETVAAAVRAGGLPPFQLTLVGEGPEEQAVRRLVRKYDLEGRIKIHNRLDREALRNLYSEQHLFVLPSREESFGLAALEARAAGLPVLAFAGTGIAGWLEDGKEGLLAKDDADFVLKFARLVRDGKLRSRMALRNRSGPAPFEWSNVVDMHLDVYQKAIASSSAL